MRLPTMRRALLGSCSPYALTLSMAGGIDPRLANFTNSFSHPTKGPVDAA